MSAAYYVVVNAPKPPFDTMVNGKALALADRKLSEAAKAKGIVPLLRFFSLSAIELEAAAAAFDLSLEKVARPEQWFEPDDGLESIQGLLALAEDPAEEFDPQVRQDLLDLSRVLRHAKASGLKWHLAVDH